jgi:threonine dehydratase
MVATGGCPVLVDEALLLEAVALVLATTGIPVDATGAAGLAGLMARNRRNMVNQEDRAAILLTGAERGAH